MCHRLGRMGGGGGQNEAREGDLTPDYPVITLVKWTAVLLEPGLLGGRLFHLHLCSLIMGPVAHQRKVMIRSLFMVGWSITGDWLIENTIKFTISIFLQFMSLFVC